MGKWGVKFLENYLVQVYDLGDAYLTYDKDGALVFMDKGSCKITALVMPKFTQKNSKLLENIIAGISVKCNIDKNVCFSIFQHLIKCSSGLTNFLGITSGDKISKADCEKLGLVSARILGCSVIGISNNCRHELIVRRKIEERLGDMGTLRVENFIELYNGLALAYTKSLGVNNLEALIGILIETVCAEAKIEGKIKFIGHSNYFNTIDANVDWIYDLESGYKKLDSLNEDTKYIVKYVKMALYDEDLNIYLRGLEKTEKPINRLGNKGVIGKIVENSDSLNKVKGKCSLTYSAVGHSHLAESNEAIKARVAWLEENYGENWKEILGTSASSEGKFTEIKEHVNIVLSTIVFDATKLIFSGRKPKCKENTMKSLYSEIFKPVLQTVTTTRLGEETRKVITEELAKYFEVIPKDIPQYMNIFSNQGLAPDGSKYR